MNFKEVKSAAFTSELIKTDITALKILKNDLSLIGIGHVTYVYKLSDQKFIFKRDIFTGQKIHGFVPSDRSKCIIIFGGKQAKIYNISVKSPNNDAVAEEPENNVHFTSLNKHFKCTDWIVNLIWIQNDTKIAILTAHNVIQIWDVKINSVTVLHHCEEKCIIYSGLLTEINNHVLAMAGTAFSQVILWSSQCEQVLQRINGHKGVIFSISYSKCKNVIVTTSDDRSVRIWNVVMTYKNANVDSLAYWKNIIIEPQATLFGHTARVISSIIQDNFIISIGEDGIMCAWEINGNLLNKKKVNQGGGLWCLDYDVTQNFIVTGGSNSGIILHKEFCDLPPPKTALLNFPDERLTAKKIALTARGNIVCITEQGYVMYYDFEIDEWSVKHEISYSKTYLCMSLSLCKQFVALAGVNGQIDIFAENCKFDPNLVHFISKQITENNILSVHWVTNRCLVVCNDNAEISLWCSQNQTCTIIATFNLPKCKEKWLTAASLEPNKKNYLLVGDRCGNLHLFQKGKPDPIETLPKIHGRIGINSIEFYQDTIMTTGRNGSIKYFSLTESSSKNTLRLQYVHHIKLPFEWVEHFIDKGKQIICGFQETYFIIWDVKDQTNIMSINCGGGHRSWDIEKSWREYENKKQNILRFIFIKNSVVQTVTTKYEDVASKSISKGFHSKEINALNSISPNFTLSEGFYIISAGEDTSIQIALCKTIENNITFEEQFNITCHLSSIRCMCLLEIAPKIWSKNVDICDSNTKEYILYSAGGRAQICVSKIIISKFENDTKIDYHELSNYMLKGTDSERKKKDGNFSKACKDMDAETRFMSIDSLMQHENSDASETSNVLYQNIILAGCSDGLLRVYRTVMIDKNKCEVTLHLSLEYHKRCILKVKSFKLKQFYIVLTLAVDGSVVFWNFTQFVNNIAQSQNIAPFHNLKIHKAGINCVDLDFIDDNRIILGTGGDDNALHLNILRLSYSNDKLRVDKLCEWSSGKYHCSQITGLKLFKNNIMISVSIDQRVTVIRWSYNELTNECFIICEYIGQYHSTIPDLQGFDVIKYDRNKITICLFGKGIEIITVDLS